MKVLVDTNVILDVLLDRAPFVDASSELLARVERGEVEGCVCATTVTTIHYLAGKVVGAAQARTAISRLLSILGVAAVNRPVIEAALESPLTDFEDAVLLEAGRAEDVRSIVTRNPADFARGDLPVHTPAELLAILHQASR